MALAGGRSLRGLGRRVALTHRHLGLRTLLWRAVSFPLRFTPLRLPLGLGTPAEQHLYAARRWQRRHAPPVAVLAPGESPPAGHDAAILGAGLQPDRHWIAAMQYAARVDPGAAAVAGRVLAADGTIESAGLCAAGRRYEGRPAGHPPAQVAGPVLAPAPELALRRHDAEGEATYLPGVVARRRSGRPAAPPPAGLGERRVHTADGHLRVVYVTQVTTVGGGHRDVFEHLNRLRARGHDVCLFSLDGPPDWFELDVEVRQFAGWDELTAALQPLDAIKVATWWRTAMPVWRASRHRGLPVYLVQDVETSYYPGDPLSQARVLDTYRSEFRYLTISGHNRDDLRALGCEAQLVPPGIDLDTFRPLGRPRREDMLLALGRGNPLKNLGLTIDAWRALGPGRAGLTLFGIEPELGARHGARYVTAPTDERVNELLNEATVFLQTSIHEGFALPPLEAMATGGAVVCTDAHGNRDFCRDGVNCLMPDPTVESVRGAVERLLGDPRLRRRLGEEGIRTARDYSWERRIDQLEAFLERLAVQA